MLTSQGTKQFKQKMEAPTVVCDWHL